jgi:hypothetical protein
MLMQTFKEWAEENHPEDEVLNEFLVDLARRVANSKVGRAAITAGALALGSTAAAPEAKGAMPQAPVMNNQKEFSDVPFNKNIGPRPDGKVSDYDLYYYQIKRVDEFLKEKQRAARAGKQIAMPVWYMKMGDHYKWKRPKPPEFSEREQAYAKFMNGKHSDEQKQMMTNLYNGTR